jgi:hypothetical protein
LLRKDYPTVGNIPLSAAALSGRYPSMASAERMMVEAHHREERSDVAIQGHVRAPSFLDRHTLALLGLAMTTRIQLRG